MAADNNNDNNLPFQQNNNTYYQNNNNAYPSFDPPLQSGGHEFASSHNWNFASERLGTPQAHDPSPSLYQGWHPPQQSDVTQSNNAFAQSRESLYAKYPTSLAQFQQGDYGNANPTGQQVPSGYLYGNPGVVERQRFEGPTPGLRDASLIGQTISPGALQQRQSTLYSPSPIMTQQLQPIPLQERPNQNEPRALPKGTPTGQFVILTPDTLARVAKVKRLHNFVDIGNESLEIWSTKTTIPSYVPRKSRNEIKQLLASDAGFKAKLAKKPSKRSSDGSIKVGSSYSAGSIAKLEQDKTGDMTSSVEPESTNDESDSEQSEEESMKPPLPAVRPTRAIEVARYDTIKSLWRVPYRSATVDDIRKGLADFWDIVRTIRDRWKSDLQAVKDAEEARKVNELPLLSERVASQRDMMEAALNAAVTEGHKDIVEHLGENLPLVLAFAQFLRDRLAELDYNSSFTKALLELLAKCKTLTATSLEKTTISKFLVRFAKRGDDQVKLLAKRITDNANNASKKRKEVYKSSAVQATHTKDALSPMPESPVAGVKRARAVESSGEPTSKRVAADANGATAANGAPQPKTAAPVKRLSSSSDTKSQAPTGTAAPVKKATQVVPKSGSFFTNNFAGLQSAKKISTSNTASTAKPSVLAKPTASSAKPAAAPVSAAKPAAPAPRSAFSIADTLALVSKPKEIEPVAKREESAPFETAEERLKRLRKEERRKLRVTFRPDSSLVQIRIMSPQPEDQLERTAHETLDAADVDSEGRMFKLKHQEEMMELDEDEEVEAAPMDDLTKAFPQPVPVDFSTISDDLRNSMYEPYGGGTKRPICPEAEIQDRREANTLIVIYAQTSDIPPSPKEPTDLVEEPVELKVFGPASELVKSRLEALKATPNRSMAGALPISKSVLDALARVMDPQQAPQQQQQQYHSAPQVPIPQYQPAPPVQAAETKTELEKLFAQYSVPNYTAQPQAAYQPPPPPPPPLQQYQQQSQQALPANLQSFLAAAAAQPSQQISAQVPQQVAPQPLAGPALDLSAILASLQQSGQMGGNTAAAGMAQLSQFLPQQQQQQSQQSAAYPFENPERRRWIDNGGMDIDDDHGDRGGWNGDRRAGGRPAAGGSTFKKKEDDGRPKPKFVVQCKYWKEGKCRKGAECTFLHT